MSAITACAVEMLPPDRPSITREANSTTNDPANPNNRYPTAEPASDSSSTGRRPQRSDSRPRIGANRNCMIEYDAMNSPKTAGDGWKRSAYRGRIGITIPKPTRSMNTIRKTMPTVARCSRTPLHLPAPGGAERRF